MPIRTDRTKTTPVETNAVPIETVESAGVEGTVNEDTASNESNLELVNESTDDVSTNGESDSESGGADNDSASAEAKEARKRKPYYPWEQRQYDVVKETAQRLYAEDNLRFETLYKEVTSDQELFKSAGIPSEMQLRSFYTNKRTALKTWNMPKGQVRSDEEIDKVLPPLGTPRVRLSLM